MNIAIRLFAGYFLIVGLAAWFVLRIVDQEIQPGVRQATEETLVDAANLLAEIAAPELAAGTLNSGRFAAAVAAARTRRPAARIYEIDKNRIEARVYVTDARGIVVYDSAGTDLGADYSQWRDVARALRGEYGARSSRVVAEDPSTSVMYVAAPVLVQGRLIGVLSVAKPSADLMPYAERSRQRILRAGALLLGVSALLGLAFTLWLTWSLNRLRDYALAVAAGRRATPPTGGGRQLSVLARALAHMREKLDGKQYVEDYVQSLTHELKSPLTAIRGAAELLQEGPPPAETQRFAGHVVEQTRRLQEVIDRLLVLARLEHLQAPESRQRCAFDALLDEAVQARQGALAARGLTLRRAGTAGHALDGDPFLLRQALGNLLDNAIDFSPAGAHITITADAGEQRLRIEFADQGPGAPDYALPHLFERFYSLPRPDGARKGSGLGLAFVREVARLHGGEAWFANRPEGGARAGLDLPAAA